MVHTVQNVVLFRICISAGAIDGGNTKSVSSIKLLNAIIELFYFSILMSNLSIGLEIMEAVLSLKNSLPTRKLSEDPILDNFSRPKFEFSTSCFIFGF